MTTITKLNVTEKANEICDKCLQLFGGYGYVKGNTIERLYRDVRGMTITGGHSEKMKMVISKFL
ncbi:acyl-CoA dehydrogenase family protein [Cellulosilyticum ruminicola]|uniref:acyl-CoA dehydrogenase family protein n=1 Tax=Cellulosilyticum ruminicola TaxID=425254 RepID=UPI0006D28FD0|nr:acyl-CoA dehydrogenase family protein [Cellulosilyticum ruminicola]